MSDRKYRQRGYQDEPRERPSRAVPRAPQPRERGPREPRAPNMPGFRTVVRCARCGNISTAAIETDTRCARCGADLHSCAQCESFDTSATFECTQPIPVRVSPKDERNTCSYFEARTTVERETGSTGPPSARQAFDDLFK
jgi:hypothetical protein